MIFWQFTRIRYLMIFEELILLGIARFQYKSLSKDHLDEIFVKNWNQHG